MEQILYRGKRKYNNEWVEGFYYQHNPPLQCFTLDGDREKVKHYILKTGFADWNMPRPVDFIEVIPETVGKFTGVFDKSKNKIFEGDILKSISAITTNFGKILTGEFDTTIYEVVVDEEESYSFGTKNVITNYISTPIYRANASKYYEVVGNVYEKPELQ